MSLNKRFAGSSELASDSELECGGKPRGNGRLQSKYKNIPKRHVDNTKPFQAMSTRGDNEHLLKHKLEMKMMATYSIINRRQKFSFGKNAVHLWQSDIFFKNQLGHKQAAINHQFLVDQECWFWFVSPKEIVGGGNNLGGINGQVRCKNGEKKRLLLKGIPPRICIKFAPSPYVLCKAQLTSNLTTCVHALWIWMHLRFAHPRFEFTFESNISVHIHLQLHGFTMSMNNDFDDSSDELASELDECDGKPRGRGRKSQSNNAKPILLFNKNLLVKEMFAAKPDFSMERFKAMSTCDANEHLPQHRFHINQNWLTDHGYDNEEEYFDLVRRLDPNFNHRQDNHQFVAAILTVLEEEREKNLKAHCQLNKEGGKQQQSGSGGQMKLNKKAKKQRHPSYVPKQTIDFNSFADLKTRYPFVSTEHLVLIWNLLRDYDLSDFEMQ